MTQEEQICVTLSHCWDPLSKRPVTTTTANLEQQLKRVPFGELPLSFKDAVQITPSLDVRYLWIDSLCIAQDSREDWEREVAVMRQIYAHSLCTLAASSSESSEGVCRVSSKAPTLIDRNSPLNLSIGSQRIRFFEKNPQD